MLRDSNSLVETAKECSEVPNFNIKKESLKFPEMTTTEGTEYLYIQNYDIFTE